MNRVILLGRLTKDPEVKYTANSKIVCQINLAVDRPFPGKDGQREADFIPVIIWGKSAEACGNYLSKGQRALFEGRLQIRAYEGKDGNKHWVSEVIADRFEFVERKGQTNKSEAAAGQQSAFDTMGNTVPDFDAMSIDF